MKMKHGWVIQETTGEFVSWFDPEDYIKGIRDALVFSTRALAREDIREYESEEIVRKVSLTKKGRAKKIIPGR